MNSTRLSTRAPLTTCALIMLALVSGGQTQTSPNVMNVATSPNGSTAADMFRDLGRVCTSAAFLRQRQTSGSVENIELLLENKVALAFVQLDVLKARDQIDQDPRAKDLRVLLPLNFDEIHLIVKRPSKDVFGRVKGIAAFSGLKGKRVGAWGGSVITAQILKAKAKNDYTIVSLNDRAAALGALNAGQIDAVLAVVGQPADWVNTLNPAVFTLAPLDIPQGSLNGFYRPARLLYPKLGVATNTYSVQRLLITRNFKTPERRMPLLAYQKCALAKLTTLQETEGMHPKWNDVTFKERDWPLFK
ncbi:transporter substrate-binding domain-containing protein [Deinococcus sp. Arct2-2]|uniref:TAXI family TRAP transporter solute-binding subunit n=1 Tax=Deinococcus sp. Arct2-2 TaxID=2568653 RepID=UPI0010A42B93|nr:TAXI family TRAP transporter solute-binding subunit [Deinococcus sp. Arct2-2]THF69642.1 transporter substrate-binding domain-containing protein [Deinococcus sp. Arct2-2]